MAVEDSREYARRHGWLAKKPKEDPKPKPEGRHLTPEEMDLWAKVKPSKKREKGR